MNERIKQLWEQSTGAAVPAEGFYSSASKYNIEKFAELIVRDVFVMLKEAMLDEDMLAVDEIIDDRLNDAAGDVVDAYGIVDRIY